MTNKEGREKQIMWEELQEKRDICLVVYRAEYLQM